MSQRRRSARAGTDAGSNAAQDGWTARAVDAAARRGLGILSQAVEAWINRGEAGPMIRELARSLDPDGVPRVWPVADWVACLALLADARRRRELGWPVEIDARVEGMLRAVLRFSRPDGSPVFGLEPADAETGTLLRFWAEQTADPALTRVIDDWFPPLPSSRKRRGRLAPPLPADARPDRPLAMLRPDWSPRGDFLSIDQRQRDQTMLELVGLGQHWLGPTWPAEATSTAKPTLWTTGAYADAAEWTFRRDQDRVTRTVVLLRGEQLAILADEVQTNGSECETRVALAPGVETREIAGSRATKLVASRQRAARVLPVALPALPYVTDHGSFRSEGGELVLRQRTSGRRSWLPLLVSWRSERDRRPTRWRVLTVSEKWTICPADDAFAVRVAWGTSESLVIYRSLAEPKLRAFLGYQTRARFLVGWFTKEGTVDPLLTVPTEE
jgi:hypothetical protein